MNSETSKFKKKHILVLAHDSALSGAQRSLLQILSNLNRSRYNITVIAPTTGPFVDEVRAIGIDCYVGLCQRIMFFRKKHDYEGIFSWIKARATHPYFLSVLSVLALPLRLAIVIVFSKLKKIDLIYTNTITVIDGVFLSKVTGTPHVWHLREALKDNMDLQCPFNPDKFAQRIPERAQKIIVNSQFLARQIFGKKEIDNVHVVRNGIDQEHIRYVAETARAGSASGCRYETLILGRVSERKGIDVYVRAMAKVSAVIPNARHYIVGSGSQEYLGYIQDLIAELNMADSIRIVGYRADPIEYLAMSRVLVSSSVQEPFGLTIIEAMAIGVPVVATRSGGPAEIIQDGRSGYLVGIGDVEAIAKRVCHLLQDDKCHKRIVEGGYRRVKSEFDLSKCVGEIQDIFDSAISGRN